MGLLNHLRLEFSCPTGQQNLFLYKFFASSGLRPFPYFEGKGLFVPEKKVVKTEFETYNRSRKTRIHGINITQHTPGCYCISVRHTGPFSLDDYETLDLEVKSARLVKR